jgi:hypothetical protein
MRQGGTVPGLDVHPFAKELSEREYVGDGKLESPDRFTLVVVDTDQEGVKLAVLCHSNLLTRLSPFR